MILGRCADHVLKNFPEAYSFFICADNTFRSRRGKNVYEGKTLLELNGVDSKRAEYYQYYTGRVWGKPANYDLSVNTSHVSMEDAADLILQYIELRQGHS